MMNKLKDCNVTVCIDYVLSKDYDPEDLKKLEEKILEDIKWHKIEFEDFMDYDDGIVQCKLARINLSHSNVLIIASDVYYNL